MEMDISLSLANQTDSTPLNTKMKIGATLVALAAIVLFLGLFNQFYTPILLSVFFALITIGSLLYTTGLYGGIDAGVKNNGVMFKSLTSRGFWAWIMGIVLTSFYIILYWYPQYLGLANGEENNIGLIRIFDPLSFILSGHKASQWFVYGTFYTVAILLMGTKFIIKNRHNKYQVFRTVSIMFFQTAFAYLIPELLSYLKGAPYNDFKQMWPLNYYFTDKGTIDGYISAGSVGMFMLLFGIAMIFIVSPILTYFYGKRWYCSWVCGCGGLAETAGDPFRQQSDKSFKAWQIERWMIHTVLALVTVITTAVLFSMFYDNPNTYWLNKNSFSYLVIIFFGILASILIIKRKSLFANFDKKAYIISLFIMAVTTFSIAAILLSNGRNILFVDASILRQWYGFFIGSIFSGVIGVGFYPIMGSRVWCRFGCPMAAILGLQQKLFSRFRITTNGSQCISCGNCSTYCEMGIDVRAYAQKGMDIVRSSCVGCGICSAVCPRGVLKLENGPIESKKLQGAIQYVNGQFEVTPQTKSNNLDFHF